MSGEKYCVLDVLPSGIVRGETSDDGDSSLSWLPADADIVSVVDECCLGKELLWPGVPITLG